MNKILENIEAIRREKGVKQEVMANKLGVTQQAYSGYFTETGDMKISRIQEIADILEVELVDIITWPVKYVPEGEASPECEKCKEKDEIIANLNMLIRELKKKK